MKIRIKNATNVLGSLTLPGPIGGAYNTYRICIWKKVIKCCMDVLYTFVNFNNLQILGCELHQNAFGGRAPPGTRWGAIALPQTP